jgi:hypothetical protein
MRSTAVKRSPEDRATDYQKMIENVQSQPGLNEILGLVHQLNDARRALNDLGSSSTYVGCASVSSTPDIAITAG